MSPAVRRRRGPKFRDFRRMFPTHRSARMFLGVAAVVGCVLYFLSNVRYNVGADFPFPLRGSRNASLYADILKSNDALCVASFTAQNETALVLIAVLSDAAHFEWRSAVRRTWGRIARGDGTFRLMFVVARPRTGHLQTGIDEEHRVHGDLLQLDYVEAYDQLTVKSASAIRWFVAHCPLAAYLLKIDEDSFLNPTRFFRFLRERPDHDRGRKVIYGKVWSGSWPRRDPTDKWYLPPEVYPHGRLPDYVDGPAYLVGADAASALITAFDVLPYLHLEDVFLTGLCAAYAQVELVHEPHFLLHGAPTSCDKLRYYVAFHGVPLSQMDLAASMALDTCVETSS